MGRQFNILQEDETGLGKTPLEENEEDERLREAEANKELQQCQQQLALNGTTRNIPAGVYDPQHFERAAI